MKKAELQIQFAWIFAIIAGSLIIAFFTIGTKINSAGNITIANELADKLQNRIASSSATKGGESFYEFPKETPIEFTCSIVNDQPISTFHVDGATQEHSLGGEILFSAQKIEDNTIFTFTKEFSPGFKLTNINYMSAQNIIYFIEDDSLGKGQILYDSMPEKAQKILSIERESLKNRNPSHVFYVVTQLNTLNTCIGQTPTVDVFRSCKNDLELLKNADLTIVYIGGDESFTTGQIQIVNADEQRVTVEKSAYYGLPLALGASFSQNIEMYECNLHKLFNEWQITIKLIKKRLELLQEEPIADSCKYIYDSIADEDEGALKEVLENMNSFFDAPSKLQKMENIYEVMEKPPGSVNDKNAQLRLGRGGCPVVY